MSPEEKHHGEASLAARELAVREREVSAKERDLEGEPISKHAAWLNRTSIALLVAAIGFVGNVAVALFNNSNKQDLERVHLQSNLILEAIKTGDQSKACKNLNFFVNLNLIDDPRKAIQNACAGNKIDAPVLPISTSPMSEVHSIGGRVTDLASGRPVSGAIVRVGSHFASTMSTGQFVIFSAEFKTGDRVVIRIEQPGFAPVEQVVTVPADNEDLQINIDRSKPQPSGSSTPKP